MHWLAVQLSPHPSPSASPSPAPTPGFTEPAPTLWVQHAASSVAAWCAHRPWLLAVLAAALVAGYTARAMIVARHDRRAREHARLILISPPPEVDPDGARVVWSTLAEILRPSWRRRLRDGRAHVALEYRWSGRQLRIGLWLPGTIAYGPVLAAIRGAWPGAACEITDPTDPVPVAAIAEGGALAPVLPPWFPLLSDHDADPLRTLIQAAAELNRHEAACVQVLARPASNRQISRLRRGVQSLRTGKPPNSLLDPATWLRGVLDLVVGVLGPTRRPTYDTGRSAARLHVADPQADRDARAAVDKLAGTPLWEVAVRYAVAHTAPGGTPKTLAPRLASVAHGLASSFGVYAGRNRLRRVRAARPARVLASRVLRRGFLLNNGELSTLAGLPTDIAVPGLDRARAKAMPAPVAVVSGGRGTKVLGVAQVGGHKVALKAADGRQHAHVIGSTGSGKSTLLANMILDDVHARRGVIVIDPKGDLINDVLDRLPADVAADKRLYLIDPDQPAGATLNPLQGDDHDLVVDHIVSIFGKIFAKHWGPRIDDTLRMACLTLLRKANATLTLIPSLLQDKQFRAAFTANLDDPEGLLGFWQWFESTPPPLRSQVIGPVLARLRSFLTRPFVGQTIGAPRSTVDMRRVLDGGILLARLPKGQIGEETARLMGSFILASAWQTATGRTRIAEDARRDAVAYIDEAHNFLNLPGSVGDMLAEARGYRFGLVLAHQNLTQMPRETQLALSANARNKVFFTCAPEDATQLAKHTMPELSDHDLSHLDAYQAACRLVVDGRETPAFTLHTLPPKPPVGESTAVRQTAIVNVTPASGDNGQAAIARLARVKPPGRQRRADPADDPHPTPSNTNAV